MFQDAYFRNTWGHAADHSIEGEFIVANQPQKYRYNPFHYAKEIPPEALKELFGTKTFQPMPLHAAFINLGINNHQQIINWCNHFGFPEYRSNGKMEIKRFNYLLETFKELFIITNLMQHASKQDLIKHLTATQMLYDNCNTSESVIKEIQDNPYLHAKVFITEELNRGLKSNFWPDFQVDGIYIKLSWRAISLEATMRFMLGQDIAIGNLPIQCQYKNCSLFFTPKNPRNIYCCKEHKEGAKQGRLQTNSRLERITNAVKAYQEGIPVKDAAKQYRITAPALIKAIEKEGELK